MNQKACILTSELLIKSQILETPATSNIKDCDELLLKSQFPVISLWRKNPGQLVFLDSCDWTFWLNMNMPLNSICQSKQIPEC